MKIRFYSSFQKANSDCFCQIAINSLYYDKCEDKKEFSCRDSKHISTCKSSSSELDSESADHDIKRSELRISISNINIDQHHDD